MGFDVAVALPAAFVAVTRTRSRKLTSALVATYDLAVAPEIVVHVLRPLVVQRSHWYAKVIGVEPDQVPSLAVSVLPTRAGPEIEGKSVLAGGDGGEVYVAV